MTERDFAAIYARRKAAGDPNVLYRNKGGTTLGLPEDLRKRLSEAADERGVSVSWLARRLLVEGLDRLTPADALRLTRRSKATGPQAENEDGS